MKSTNRREFLLTTGSLVASALALPGQQPAEEKLSFIENEQLRLGVNLAIGGSITFLSSNGGPNMINSHDWGRQIQMSFYSGPNPFEPNGKKPRKDWAQLGWNPIQSGDCYGNRSEILEHRNDGKKIYVKCRPMHWPHDNQPAQCVFECWYRLDGARVQVKSRLTNARDDHTQYAARTQELPAIYTNGPWYKLVSYKGEKPFSGAEPTVLVTKGDGRGWPWRNFYTPEHWVALLDDNDFGLGVYLPGVCAFTGGFAGAPKGKGGPKDSQTGYMGPTIREILDHNIVFTYEYTLIVGSLMEIRSHVYERERDRTLPHWEFKQDRQHWILQNVTDSGWPIQKGALRVSWSSDQAALVSPQTFWDAEEAPKIVIRASFQTAAKSAVVLLQPHDELAAGDWAQWGPERAKRPQPAAPIEIPFQIEGDGEVRDVEIDLSADPKYRGAMTQVKLLLPAETGTAILQSVALQAASK
ncbi:MAG: hypothetical protein HQ519_13320 [Planctomycetes bacterium]|nr:hypothetical protein [Planctomycetota bacterium]